ncbi:MAG: hypothetical protein EBZ59_10810 [Planctomycetia bacterium]|nr:hypothetical protein [Planctomycetia bacterium]
MHFAGQVSASGVAASASPVDEPPFPHNPMIYQDDAPLRHGPSFRTLQGMFLDRSGGWARLTAFDPDVVAAPRGAVGWTVPVALLDGCIVACAVYSYILCGKRVEVPVRLDRVRFLSAPRAGEKCALRLVFRAQSPRETSYDFILRGDDGRTLVEVEGLHLAAMAERGPAA